MQKRLINFGEHYLSLYLYNSRKAFSFQQAIVSHGALMNLFSTFDTLNQFESSVPHPRGF